MCFLNEKVPCQFVCISSLSLLWYVFIYLFYISLSTSLYLSRFLSLFSLVWERERRCKFSTRNRTLSCSPFFHTLAHLRSFARSLSRSPSSSRFRIHSTLAPRFCFFSSFPFARFIFSLLPRLQIAWSYSPFVHAQLSGAGSLFNRICDVIPRFSFCYTLRNLCNDIRKRIQRSYC